MNIAIIFAGGSGVRMGAGMPKQFLEINGKPIIIHTLDNFQNSPSIDKIYISCKKDYITTLQDLTKRFAITKVCGIVEGGSNGQDSIYRALRAADAENDKDAIVLIHDGVRPFVSEEVIQKNIECVKQHGSAVTCTSFFETPILSKGGEEVEEMPLKKEMFTAQAPQSFRLGDVLQAHDQVRKSNPNYEGIIDTCTLMRSVGKEVHLVEGNRGNIKVTTPEDLYVFRAMLEYKETQQALGLAPGEIAQNLKK